MKSSWTLEKAKAGLSFEIAKPKDRVSPRGTPDPEGIDNTPLSPPRGQLCLTLLCPRVQDLCSPARLWLSKICSVLTAPTGEVIEDIQTLSLPLPLTFARGKTCLKNMQVVHFLQMVNMFVFTVLFPSSLFSETHECTSMLLVTQVIS